VAVLELYKARSVKSPAARFTGFFHYIRRVFGFQLRSLPISFYTQPADNFLHPERRDSLIFKNRPISARAILSKLRAGALKDRFTARDVHRPRWAGLDDHDHVQLGLDLLRDHDWIAPIELETGGRPRVEYAINPRGKP
jgi:hypothetical protein